MTDTKTRILDVSLSLFNSEGERQITTNHIAEAAGISPGNLYYHFRNKGAIVAALFVRYETRLLTLLQEPATEIGWREKMFYFEGILASMWQYRFFHRDLSHFLQSDELLHQRYRAFVRQVLARGRVIYQHMRNSGVLTLDDDQLEGLLVNTWVLMSSWASTVNALHPQLHRDEKLENRLMKQGIYQLICLETPYLSDEARAHLDELRVRYQAADPFVPLLLGNEDLALSATSNR